MPSASSNSTTGASSATSAAGGPMLVSALWMALREVRRNLGRSLLTALGIVIGVGAVITLLTLGQGATARVQRSVSALGNNMLTVMPGSMRRGAVSSAAPAFTAADVRAVREEVPSASAVAPLNTRSALVVFA